MNQNKLFQTLVSKEAAASGATQLEAAATMPLAVTRLLTAAAPSRLRPLWSPYYVGLAGAAIVPALAERRRPGANALRRIRRSLGP